MWMIEIPLITYLVKTKNLIEVWELQMSNQLRTKMIKVVQEITKYLLRDFKEENPPDYFI